ncbi:MAG: hypothetical protein JWP13_407 [Candidatus Saccharibacteria bacterium]|nr:hypothetical protein [Candidatus Saccharibacteria bacterium]
MLWIIGKVFTDFQQYLDNHAIPYGVFVDKQKPISLPDSVQSLALDMSSKAATFDSLQALPISPDVSAVMTAGYEQYVVPAAWISEYFKVPGPSINAAIAATNKSVMRKAFMEHDTSITPHYQQVSSWQDVEKFMESHSFPVMLKPTNLMKSLFVTQNSTPEELRDNYRLMTEELPRLKQELGLVEVPGIIIEECMVGSMHTVAGFVDSRGGVTLLPEIADCITAQNLGLSDNYLYSRTLPTTLSQDDQASVLSVARSGVQALGLTSSPLHIEIILMTTGPKIIEIGARIGGYRSRMYAYSCGFDMYQASIDTAHDRLLRPCEAATKSCAFIEIFADMQGTFTSIQNLDQLDNLKNLISFSPKRKPGDLVGPAKMGYRAALVIMLGDGNLTSFQKDAEYIRDNLKVLVS